MNIIEAMKAAKDGERVSRRVWEEGEYITTEGETVIYFPILIFPKEKFSEDFVPTFEDYFEEDWEIK
jgi:hypothetical protein